MYTYRRKYKLSQKVVLFGLLVQRGHTLFFKGRNLVVCLGDYSFHSEI